MAYEFASASSQYISASNPVSAAPFTISCWANVNNTSANRSLVSLNQNSGTNRFVLYVSSLNFLAFYINASSGDTQPFISSPTVSSNTWFHACAVESAANDHRVILNGTTSNTTTVSRTPASINALNIGNDRVNNTNTGLLNGRIAEVGVWDVALTDAEITSLSNGMACSLVRPDRLVYYAPLIRDLIEYSGGLSLTNNGTSTVSPHPRIYA